MRSDERARAHGNIQCPHGGEMRIDGRRQLRMSTGVPRARHRRRPDVLHGHGLPRSRLVRAPRREMWPSDRHTRGDDSIAFMPARLTIADVERMAALAHLERTAEEKELFARQLADILAYAEQVQAIDTSGVAATAHVHADERNEREDNPRPSLSVEEALSNAPDGVVDAGLFRAPRVIG